jgi:hypothetical protein
VLEEKKKLTFLFWGKQNGTQGSNNCSKGQTHFSASFFSSKGKAKTLAVFLVVFVLKPCHVGISKKKQLDPVFTDFN